MGESSVPLLPRKEVKDVNVKEEPRLTFQKKTNLKKQRKIKIRHAVCGGLACALILHSYLHITLN